MKIMHTMKGLNFPFPSTLLSHKAEEERGCIRVSILILCCDVDHLGVWADELQVAGQYGTVIIYIPHLQCYSSSGHLKRNICEKPTNQMVN